VWVLAQPCYKLPVACLYTGDLPGIIVEMGKLEFKFASNSRAPGIPNPGRSDERNGSCLLRRKCYVCLQYICCMSVALCGRTKRPLKQVAKWNPKYPWTCTLRDLVVKMYVLHSRYTAPSAPSPARAGCPRSFSPTTPHAFLSATPDDVYQSPAAGSSQDVEEKVVSE